MMGNLARLHTGLSSHHYEGHRPDALQGSQWGGENTSNVSDCIRF